MNCACALGGLSLTVLVMGVAGGSVRFFCTAGAGMETFLVEEVKHKLAATEVELIPGRVFFTCCSALQDVMRLKSAERLFLLLHQAPPTPLPTNPAKAASVIQQSIVGDPDVWTSGLSIWSRVQEELGGSAECGRGQKRKREAEEEEENEDVRNEGRTTFRVSCRCSGAVARCYNAQNLNRIIGTVVTQQLGWRADLRNPTVEVNVYLSDDHSVVGIPLLRHPLASRSYLKHTGLRSTIAWAMTSLCDLQESSVVLDPMCGVGTILLEAAQQCPKSVFIGMDTSQDQLRKALENVEAAGQEGRIVLVRSSCMGIPLPPGCVDAVLCDVPFGRKFSCSTDMTAAFPRILAEMERVLRQGGTLVLLLSLQLSAQIKKLIPPDLQSADRSVEPPTSESDQHGHVTRFSSLVLKSRHRVSLGSTDALIHTYRKTCNQGDQAAQEQVRTPGVEHVAHTVGCV